MANNNNKNLKDQNELEESLNLLDRMEEIPAYKLAAKGGLGPVGAALEGITDKQVNEDLINQALFDLGAQVFNQKTVPINILSGFFAGYNPGFSGERLMQNIQQRFGWGEDEGARTPTPRSDPDYPFGVYAPEGGQRQTTLLPQAPAEVQDKITPPVEKVMPTDEMIAPSYSVDDINPNLKAKFDNFLTFSHADQDAYFQHMPEELQDALSIYRDSLLDQDKELKLAEERGKRKEDVLYNPKTDDFVRKNVTNLQ